MHKRAIIDLIDPAFFKKRQGILIVLQGKNRINRLFSEKIGVKNNCTNVQREAHIFLTLGQKKAIL